MGRAADDQLALKLEWNPDLTTKSFIVTEGNHEAYEAVSQPERWPSRALALIGPEGSGKTHLAHIWARSSNTKVHKLSSEFDIADLKSLSGTALWAEQAESFPEETLFALINAAMTENIDGLLMTSTAWPKAWKVNIPDLRSRLNALTSIFVEPVSDEALRDVYIKLFSDYGLKVGDDAIKSLVTYAERSVPAARRAVSDLEKLAMARKVKISRRLVSEYLNTQSDLFDG